MTKTQFMEWLQRIQSDGHVMVFNGDPGHPELVTGCVYDTGIIELTTDREGGEQD